MTMQSFTTFSDLSSLTLPQIKQRFGGKTVGLMEAYSLQIAVPQSWFLSSEVFLKFTSGTFKKKEFLDKACIYVKEQFSKAFASLPDVTFAVRSSAIEEDSAKHSFAGIFESKLNVPKNQLHEAIASVWDSCYSMKATSYLEGADVAMAVIIQPMIESKFGGVCFSKHPSPANVFENQEIVIEFANTSCEKIVQGEITPFRLSGTIDTIASASDQPWVDALLKNLLALKKFHHHEVDIEFVIDQSENLFLVQQRPLSTHLSSSTLDLSHYERKYKRPLLSLDVEFLIDGCSQFLAPYLEIPYQLERFMVMTTNPDGNQELWIHKLLNEAVTCRIAEKIQEDQEYLERMQARYFTHYNAILENDYRRFFKPILPLERRFLHFCEWITPLCAHYYVPMFMIDALELVLKNNMEKIDPENAENDLLFLGTSGISTLMDLLQDELRNFKEQVHLETYEALNKEASLKLDVLTRKYSFLKCRAADEEGFTSQDLFVLMKNLEPKEITDESSKRDALIRKYFPEDRSLAYLAEFRSWMRIRSQEMEYFMYALYSAKSIFSEIANLFNLPLHLIWNSSKEKILASIEHKDPKWINKGLGHHLSIFRSFGKTRMIDSLKIERKKESLQKGLKGKRVFGQGKITGRVKIAFNAKDLEKIKKQNEPCILVTSMTTPDFIPFLKKNFVALITDEGGILCHAAIIARESAIPCLVATNVATETLKEGDLITIDFDKGQIAI